MFFTRPVTITYRHFAPSKELTRLVQHEAQELEHRPGVTTVRVAVDRPHRRHHGQPYRARVELTIPGRPLVATANHQDPQIAVSEAFRAVAHALASYVGRRRSAPPRLRLPWGSEPAPDQAG